MFLKIGLNKSGLKYYAIGYYEQDIPIIVTFNVGHVAGICKALGFNIPKECGTYRII